MTAASLLAFANAMERSWASSGAAVKIRKARKPSTAVGREVGFDMVFLFKLKKLFA
jgi:hypothetical protein